MLDRIVDASNPQEPVNLYYPGDDLFTPFERRRGLPIGNLTSQLFANVYLDRFDHFVTAVFRAPYLRYVDEFGGQVPGEAFGVVQRWGCECPEMVVLPGGNLAMGRYEVTVGEYRAFASVTGGSVGGGCITLRDGDSWRDPGFPQTDRHPETCVSWDDARAYVSWLSRTTGMGYRLPAEAEWDRAAAGSQPGCDRERTGNFGTCPVGSYGSNASGLSDMVGNLDEWTEDCWEGKCGRRVLRGGSWFGLGGPAFRRALVGPRRPPELPNGFRVSRTLD